MKLMNRNLNFDSFAYIFMTIAVAFTALGPFVHYAFGGLALICLIIARIRQENTFCPCKLGKNEKYTMIFLLFFAVWGAFPNALVCRDFYIWGKGASVCIEAVLFTFMAAMLFNTDERRERLLDVTIIFNIIFCADLIRRGIGIYPEVGFNGAIANECAVGNYIIYVWPLSLVYYICSGKNFTIKMLSLFITFLAVFASFSAGAWITALGEVVLFALYALVAKLITPQSCKKIVATTAALICVFCAFYTISDYATNGFVSDHTRRELGQVSELDDAEKLTNNRYKSWQATLYLISQHPFTGYGRDAYAQSIIDNLDKFPKELDMTEDDVLDHAHNMILMTACSWGIPTLIFFLVALCLSLLKLYRIMRQRKFEYKIYCWELAEFLLLAGMFAIGIGQDLFEGRRDIAVLFYGYWGVLIALPASYHSQTVKKGDLTQ